MMDSNERDILLNDKRLILSLTKMTWDEGEVYCQGRSGHIASILDAKTLSAVLEKMAELGECTANIMIYLLEIRKTIF